MSNSESFELPIGASVRILTTTGAVFTGTFLGTRHHHGDSNALEQQFILVQLTATTGPFTVGEIIAINVRQIVVIGPIEV